MKIKLKWIEWTGGDCPVKNDQRVSYKLRNGSIHHDKIAGVADWRLSSSECSTDIVAYSLFELKEEKKKKSKWTEWSGGKCPLPEDVMVEVELRSGDKSVYPAGRYRWGHSMSATTSGDILRYRPFDKTSLKKKARLEADKNAKRYLYLRKVLGLNDGSIDIAMADYERQNEPKAVEGE